MARVLLVVLALTTLYDCGQASAPGQKTQENTAGVEKTQGQTRPKQEAALPAYDVTSDQTCTRDGIAGKCLVVTTDTHSRKYFTALTKHFRDENPETKAVDIALATGLLGNAYRDNYDAAVLVAGDGDYVPLVEEAKRLGKVVHVTFFGEKEYGLSPDLRLASDRFWDLEEVFAEAWERYDSTV